MPLVVLDDSNWATANTYVEVAGVDEATHLEAMERLSNLFRFYGARLHDDQALDFPRTKLFVKGRLRDAGTVYAQLAFAQSKIVAAIEAGYYDELGETEDFNVSIGPLSMSEGKSSSSSSSGYSSSSSKKPAVKEKSQLELALLEFGEMVEGREKEGFPES